MAFVSRCLPDPECETRLVSAECDWDRSNPIERADSETGEIHEYYACKACGTLTPVVQVDGHTVEISGYELAVLSQELSAAELRDYLAVEIAGFGIREWGRKSGIAHQNISPRVRKARLAVEELDEIETASLRKTS